MKLRFELLNKIFVFQSSIRSKRNKEFVIGYTNRCKDGKYIVTLDYDNSIEGWVFNEVKALQKQFNLGDFYIFESNPDCYHAVCFDKLTLSDYLDVLKNSTVDPNYITVPLYFGKKIWTLRLTDKDKVPIKFLKKLEAKDYFKQTSSAHADIIAKLFRIDIKLFRPDFEQEIILSRYPI